MKGRLFAIGVGPGDPELLTLKAVNILKEIDIIACPSKENRPGIAYDIAAKAVPEILEKQVIALEFPMTEKDTADAHKKAAKKLMQVLDKGNDTAFLTLGDPGIYSTFSYISDLIRQSGYEVTVISGISSFSAAAAKLLLPLALGDGSVMITSKEYADNAKTLVIMKAAGMLKEIKDKVKKTDKDIYMVENCGMEDERIYKGIDSIPDEAGYFSIVIVTDKNTKDKQ